MIEQEEPEVARGNFVGGPDATAYFNDFRFDPSSVADFLPQYDVQPDHISFRDPVWGETHIGDKPGDEVFISLMDTPLVRRVMNIEQLTLPAEYSTIPNTAAFSRFEGCGNGAELD